MRGGHWVTSPDQIAFNEWIDVAVQDSVGIAHFLFSAVILNQAIGMEHIRSDLAAPGDFQLAVFDGTTLGSFLLQLILVKTGT